MSFDYESTNRALLSRYNLDDIIYVNTTPHLLRCLAEGKSITALDYSSEVANAVGLFVIAAAISGCLALTGVWIGTLVFLAVGGAISAAVLFRAANRADELRRLWEKGVLIAADEVRIEEREYEDDGDIRRACFAIYAFQLPQGEMMRDEVFVPDEWKDKPARTVLMLYRSPKDYLIL
jgi:hypothetical protein